MSNSLKTEGIHVKLTKQERMALERYAHNRSLNLSESLRALLRQGLADDGLWPFHSPNRPVKSNPYQARDDEDITPEQAEEQAAAWREKNNVGRFETWRQPRGGRIRRGYYDD